MDENNMIRDIKIMIDEMKFKVREQRRTAEDSMLKADFLEREVIRLENMADKWVSKLQRETDVAPTEK